MAAQGGDRAGAAQQGTGGEEGMMRGQRRRQLEQWLGPYLSDRGGSQTDRRGFDLKIQGSKEGNCSHTDRALHDIKVNFEKNLQRKHLRIQLI